MPLFDFRCPRCHVVTELLTSADAEPLCPRGCTMVMDKLPSAPSFKVLGFNQQTGYASEQVRRETKNGITTEVRGNFEAFDRLT